MQKTKGQTRYLFASKNCLWGPIRGTMAYLSQSFLVIIGETLLEDNERPNACWKKKYIALDGKTALKVKTKISEKL